jgi:hypothetical protein
MDDSQESRLNKKSKMEEAKTLESNPVAQALLKMLENQEPVRTCQLMSELSSLAEEEQAADDKEREP